VAVDGDVCRLRTPLHLRVDQGALTVLAEPEAPEGLDGAPDPSDQRGT
jgi:hypothetical protein